MKFASIKEYFYRLYNYNLVMMFLPIAEFVATYYLFLSGTMPLFIVDEDIILILLICLPIIVVVWLTIVHLRCAKKFKQIAEEPSLGKKLEDYYPVAQQKVNSMVFTSFLLAFAFLFTAHAWFSIYFGVVVLWVILQWPSPRRVCRQLKLRGDEREMVRTRGTAFGA